MRVTATAVESVDESIGVLAPAKLQTAHEAVDSEKTIPLMRALFESIDQGFLICELLHDERGRANDYRVLVCNSALERLTGIARNTVLERRVSEIIPDEFEWWVDTFADIVASGQARRFERGVGSIGRTWDVTVIPFDGNYLAVLYDDVTERQRAEIALRESENRLATELSASKVLQNISSKLISEHQPELLYSAIADAAIVLMQSYAASIQIYNPRKGALKLLASKNFHPESAKLWEWVTAGSGTSCGRALVAMQRVIVKDSETCEFLGLLERQEFARSGLRAFQSTPLLSRSGQLLGMMSTHWRTPHAPDESDFRLFDVLARQVSDLIERAHAEESLRESECDLRLAIETGRFGTWNVNLETNELVCSANCKAQFGRKPDEPFSYRDFVRSIHPDDRSFQASAIDKAVADKGALEIQHRCIWPDGSVHWVEVQGRYTECVFGSPRMAGLSRDMTDLKSAELRQQLLIDELNHRVKNTLATVQSFAVQTLRTDTPVREGREKLGSRLVALAKTHDILTREHWEGAAMFDVVAEGLAAYRGNPERPRIVVAGDVIRLLPKAALAFSMAIHELATNAVKYGALANDTGTVEIAWWTTSDNPARFRFRWVERGGPAIRRPSRRGFGSKLIEQGLAQEVAAAVNLTFSREGLLFTADAPLAEMTGRPAPVNSSRQETENAN